LKKVSVEADFLGVFDEHLDGRLVVEDHLRLAMILAFRGMSKFDEILGFQPAVGVALEPAGCPGEVDHQAVEDVACVRTGRAVLYG
jgi:hypothetical protein